MATTLTWNFTPLTSLEDGAKVGTLQPTSWNFVADWAKKESRPTEVVLTNLRSPLDTPTTLRFAFNKVNNVYAGTGIDPNVYAPNRNGFSVLAQMNQVVTVNDSETGKRIDLPLSAHIVLKGPANGVITGTIVANMITQLIGALYEQGAATMDARLSALTRGALVPAALV